MRWMRVLRQRAKSLLAVRRADDELRRELDFHIEQLSAEYRAEGMTDAEARDAARRAMGALGSIEEQCRDERRMAWFTEVVADVRYGARMLGKTPGFTALAVLALGLGCGASVAVYTLAEALLLRSLPYPSPERLVAVEPVHQRHGPSGAGQEDFRDWRASNTVFNHIALSESTQGTLTGAGEPELITGSRVSDGYFEVFGVQPALGRWFAAADYRMNAEPAVILSHALWLRKFNGRKDVIGTSIFLAGKARRIAAVMPRDFRMNDGYKAEFWRPLDYINYGRRQHQYTVYARLKDGVRVELAQAQMSEIARRLERAYPETNKGWGIRVTSMRGALLRELGPALRVFTITALVVLLVGCANVASLLLARGVGRAKEMAVRLALGASRARLVRLLLAESLMLAALGCAAGLLLAYGLVRAAVVAAPVWMELDSMIEVSPWTASFLAGLTLATGLLTGLSPALKGSRPRLERDLKESGAAMVGRRREQRTLNVLVVGEIALAVVLLSLGGLLARGFAGLTATRLGFRSNGVLTFRLPLSGANYASRGQRLEFWDRLLARLATVPGVVAVAAGGDIPLSGDYYGTDVEVEGRANPRDWRDAMTQLDSVTPGYFHALGIPLHAGRDFEPSDTRQAEPVVIVNEEFVRRWIEDGRAVGRRVREPGNAWRRIVGVVGDVRNQGPARPVGPELYTPVMQGSWAQWVVLRTALAERALIGPMRRVVHELDPDLALADVRPVEEIVEQQLAQPREMLLLTAGFALITLLMATLGLGGVMAYAVSRRRREIGLRVALGASGGDVAWSVLRRALRLIATGSAVGVAGSLAVARLVEAFLYGASPRDPLALAGAPAVLILVAVAATLVPARRAASVDPLTALRQE
jgi:predicted permease